MITMYDINILINKFGKNRKENYPSMYFKCI